MRTKKAEKGKFDSQKSTSTMVSVVAVASTLPVDRLGGSEVRGMGARVKQKRG